MSIGLYVGAGLAIVISTIFLFYPKRRKLLTHSELQSLPSKDWNPAEDAGLTDSDGNPITGGAPRRHRDFPNLVVPTEESDTICKLFKARYAPYVHGSPCLRLRFATVLCVSLPRLENRRLDCYVVFVAGGAVVESLSANASVCNCHPCFFLCLRLVFSCSM